MCCAEVICCVPFSPKATLNSELVLSQNSLNLHMGKDQNTYPGYKKLISTEFIQPLIQEVEEKRQHVMACRVEAERTVS